MRFFIWWAYIFFVTHFRHCCCWWNVVLVYLIRRNQPVQWIFIVKKYWAFISKIMWHYLSFSIITDIIFFSSYILRTRLTWISVWYVGLNAVRILPFYAYMCNRFHCGFLHFVRLLFTHLFWYLYVCHTHLLWPIVSRIH